MMKAKVIVLFRQKKKKISLSLLFFFLNKYLFLNVFFVACYNENDEFEPKTKLKPTSKRKKDENDEPKKKKKFCAFINNYLLLNH